MKKLPLILLTIVSIFLQNCDERITPKNEQISSDKSTLIAQKWIYEEINFDVDGKKIVMYGNNKTPNLKVQFLTTPNDFFLFNNNGILETYTDSKRKTEKGTWKFVNNQKQVELTNAPSVALFDVDNLTPKSMELSFTVVMANLDKESIDRQTIIAIAAFGNVIQETSKKVKYTMKLVAN